MIWEKGNTVFPILRRNSVLLPVYTTPVDTGTEHHTFRRNSVLLPVHTTPVDTGIEHHTFS